VRNFVPEKGAKTQEYFVYFKFLQRIYDTKFPQSAADDIVWGCPKLIHCQSPNLLRFSAITQHNNQEVFD
jgi:hypothetical protein